jgi:hypothetical protein
MKEDDMAKSSRAMPYKRQISLVIAETALYSRFGGGIGKREKEEAYVKGACVKQVLSCFNSTPLAN